MSFTYLMNLFILNTLPAYTENLKHHITHVVWFHMRHTYLRIVIFRDAVKEAILKIGKLMVFLQLLGFFQWSQLFRQMVNVWNLKHIMVFYSLLFSALKPLLPKKLWKRQSEPEKNEVYFIFFGFGKSDCFSWNRLFIITVSVINGVHCRDR